MFGGIQVFSLGLHTLRMITLKNKHLILSSSELAVKHGMGEDRVGRSCHFICFPTPFPVGCFEGSLVHARTSLRAWLMLCFSELLSSVFSAAPTTLIMPVPITGFSALLG